MNEYIIEFTTTVEVEAKDEEEAIRKAEDMVSMEDMYIYINSKCMN